MARTYINNLNEKIGQEVTLDAWVQAIRNQGGIKFLILRDISGTTQAVTFKSSPVFAETEKLSLESVVEVKGKVKEEKQAPGGFEVEILELKILSHAEPELPIPVVVEKGAEDVDITKRLDFRWLDLRKPNNAKIFKVWTSLEKGFRKYAFTNNFIQIYTPSFMKSASESGADVFEAKYFDKKAYLAQSPQFYKQAAMASGLEKVFIVGPVFRAEPSFTSRHMTEFTGWDFEISFIESHFDVMNEEEKMIVEGFNTVNEELKLNLEIPKTPFPRLPLSEVKKKLADAKVKSEKDYDISPQEERKICEIVKKETGNDFLFVIDWPIEARPFYHMRYEDNNKLTKSFDLLYKGVEVTTGAQREHRYEVLVSQAKEKKVNIKQLQYYFDFFKYGCPPHGGVGMGPGRIIMQMLNLSSVKEATFLPRDVKRLSP